MLIELKRQRIMDRHKPKLIWKSIFFISLKGELTK